MNLFAVASKLGLTILDCVWIFYKPFYHPSTLNPDNRQRLPATKAPWIMHSSPTRLENVDAHSWYECGLTAPDAPVLLCLHGMNLDGRTFQNLTDLQRKYRIIAYQFPEKSSHYTGTINDFTAILNDFIITHKIRKINVFGVSFGALIALSLVQQYQQSIDFRSIIISNAPLPGSSLALKARSRKMAAWTRRQTDTKLHWFINLVQKVALIKERKYYNINELKSILQVKHIDFYRQLAEVSKEYDGPTIASDINLSTLIMWGNRDSLFGSDEVASYKKSMPHARIAAISGGTHAMVLLEPKKNIQSYFPIFRPEQNINQTTVISTGEKVNYTIKLCIGCQNMEKFSTFL